MPRRKDIPQQQTCAPARASGEDSVLMRWKDLPGAELLAGDYHHHAFLPHWHDAYMLAATAQGPQRIHYRGTEQILSPDDLVSLNPGEVHDGEAANPEGGWQFRALYLSEAIVRDMLQIYDSPLAPVFESALQDSQAAADFLQLHTKLQHASSKLERESLLTLSLPSFFGIRDSSAVERGLHRASPALHRVREYLDAEWANAVALDDLSSISGLSRYHLLRSFRTAFGLPPHAYQMQLRVWRAKDLLFEGMPASEAALETGFYDQAHMTNTLRRYTGATPRRMRTVAQ
jgi:AraC-like DNA-binding protein